MSFSASESGKSKDVEAKIRDNKFLPHSVKAFVSDQLTHDSRHSHNNTDSVSVSVVGHAHTDDHTDGECFVRVEIKHFAAEVEETPAETPKARKPKKDDASS